MRRFQVYSVLTGIVFSISCCAFSAEPFQRGFLAADSSKNRIAIIGEDGGLQWESKIGPLHDLHQLENGNLLFQTNWTHIVEVDPATQKIIWDYDSSSANGNTGKKVEVHAFQRLGNGSTMIAESGVARIIEVDRQGKIQHQVSLRVAKPHPHRDTRIVRKLDSGNYLVCHEGDGLVREYSPDGATVWEFAVPLFDKPPATGHGVDAWGNQCFAALRLAGGNTLISTGNGHAVLEVAPNKDILWHLKQNDLPGIQLAWVTTLQVLPSGNIVVGNCHAGPNNPQLIEITRDKQVVWKYYNWERFGDSLTNSAILSVDGDKIVAKMGSHR